MDHQTETRTEYLAGLAVSMGLPVRPIAEHLLTPVEASEDDEWRIDLAVNVLVDMARRGRDDAVPPLRGYVADGRHWHWALDAMWESGGPSMCQGLDTVVLARLDDAELYDAVDPAWGPWTAWSTTRPRVRAALQPRTHHVGALATAEQRRAEVETATGAQLVALARMRNGRALAELGRRGDLVVLDLAEEHDIRTRLGTLPGLAPALNGLGSAALPRARDWITRDDPLLVSGGIAVLAEHGDPGDIPVLMKALTDAAQAGHWCAAEKPARGLGRLHATQAAPVLRDLWATTTHSYARADILAGLCGAAPQHAGQYVDEAFDDCEPRVRRLACDAAGPNVPPMAPA